MISQQLFGVQLQDVSPSLPKMLWFREVSPQGMWTSKSRPPTPMRSWVKRASKGITAAASSPFVEAPIYVKFCI